MRWTVERTWAERRSSSLPAAMILDRGRAGRRRAQHHPDPERLLVLGSGPLEQPRYQVGRSHRRADLPGARQPPVGANMGVDLGPDLGQLDDGEAEALGRIPAR